MDISRKNLLAGVLGLMLAAAAPADPVRAAPEPARLSGAQKALIGNIEDYLNGITTVEAGFLQLTATGQFAKGKLYLHRPGRMRFEYEPPVPYLLVSDGTWFIFVDEELEQATYLPLKKTPAYMLLRKGFSFSEGLIVTGMREQSGTVQVVVVDENEPDTGQVTLTFFREPLSLKSWTVEDPQGQRIQVTLVDPLYGKPLDKGLFQFVNKWEKRKE